MDRGRGEAACHAPLNSSIWAISGRISGVRRDFDRSSVVIHYPIRFHPMGSGAARSIFIHCRKVCSVSYGVWTGGFLEVKTSGPTQVDRELQKDVFACET